jgi:hypothetical protein
MYAWNENGINQAFTCSQSPVKNAIRGDLIRTLLIQVQKTKVDVDLAMAALDKLLKSNELNFAFLGKLVF